MKILENYTSLVCLMPGVKQEINKHLKNENPKDKIVILKNGESVTRNSVVRMLNNNEES